MPVNPSLFASCHSLTITQSNSLVPAQVKEVVRTISSEFKAKPAQHSVLPLIPDCCNQQRQAINAFIIVSVLNLPGAQKIPETLKEVRYMTTMLSAIRKLGQCLEEPADQTNIPGLLQVSVLAGLKTDDLRKAELTIPVVSLWTDSDAHANFMSARYSALAKCFDNHLRVNGLACKKLDLQSCEITEPALVARLEGGGDSLVAGKHC